MVHQGQHKSTSSLRVVLGCAGLVLATIVFVDLRERRAPTEPVAASPATASARYAFVGASTESVPRITDQTGSVHEIGVVNIRHAGARQLFGANEEQLPDDQFSIKLGTVDIKSSKSLDFSSENIEPGLMWLPIGLQDVSSGDPWVTMCLMDYKKYQDKPSATPMYANMVAMSLCGRGAKDKSGNPGLGAAAVVRMSNLLKSITESGLEPVPPKGFIYHETRCGSTLAANMLAALPPSRVFSEAKPPVQGIRMCMEAECDSETITKVLRGTVALMGRRRSEGEHHEHLYFKFQNSKFLPEISAVFPEVPWVFVFRDPVEVMVSNLRSLQAGPCVRIPRQERIRLNGGGGEQGDLPGKMVLGKLPGRQFGMKGRGGEGGVRRLAGVAELHGDNGGGLASLRARMLGGTDAETDPWQGSWPTDSDGGSVAHAGYPASEARDPWGLSKTDGRSTSSRKAGLAISATEADKGEGAGRGGVVPIAGLLQLASPSKHEADSYDQSYTTSDDSLEFSGVHRLVAVEGVRGGLLGKIRRRLGVGVDRRRSLLVSRQKQKLSASMCKECADWLKMLCDAAVKAHDASPQTALFVDYSNLPEAMPEHVFPTHFGLKQEMDQLKKSGISFGDWGCLCLGGVNAPPIVRKNESPLPAFPNGPAVGMPSTDTTEPSWHQAVPNWKDLMYEAAGTYSKGGLRGKATFAGDVEQKHREASPLIIQAAEEEDGLYESYSVLKSLQSWRRPEN